MKRPPRIFVAISVLAAMASLANAQTTLELIPKNSQWVYLDDGSDLGLSNVSRNPSSPYNPMNGYGASNWKHPDFDDSGWGAPGAGELGFGDGPANPEATLIDKGPIGGQQKIVGP